jgi:hypothetical protein
MAEVCVRYVGVLRTTDNELRFLLHVTPEGGETVHGLIAVEHPGEMFPEISLSADLLPFMEPIRWATVCGMRGKLAGACDLTVGSESEIEAEATVSEVQSPSPKHTAVRVTWKGDTAGLGMIFTLENT